MSEIDEAAVSIDAIADESDMSLAIGGGGAAELNGTALNCCCCC